MMNWAKNLRMPLLPRKRGRSRPQDMGYAGRHRTVSEQHRQQGNRLL